MNLKEKSTMTFEWSSTETLKIDVVEYWVNLVGRNFVLHLTKGEESKISLDISQLQPDTLVYLKVTLMGFSRTPDNPKRFQHCHRNYLCMMWMKRS